MSRQGKIILAVFLLLVGASALFLARLSSAGQTLGQPGLRVAAMELHNEDGEVVRTEGVALPAKVIDCTSEPTPVTRAAALCVDRHSPTAMCTPIEAPTSMP